MANASCFSSRNVIFLTWFVQETWVKKPVCLLKKANRLFKVFWIHKYAKISWRSVATTKLSATTQFFIPFVCWIMFPRDEYDLKTVGILTSSFLRSTTCAYTFLCVSYYYRYYKSVWCKRKSFCWDINDLRTENIKISAFSSLEWSCWTEMALALCCTSLLVSMPTQGIFQFSIFPSLSLGWTKD